MWIVVFLAALALGMFLLFWLPGGISMWAMTAAIVAVIAGAMVVASLSVRPLGMELWADANRPRWAARVLREGACPACGRAIGPEDLVLPASLELREGVGLCPGCGTAWDVHRLGARMDVEPEEPCGAAEVGDEPPRGVEHGWPRPEDVLLDSVWMHDDAGRATPLYPEWIVRAYSFEPAAALCDWMSPEEGDFDAAREALVAHEATSQRRTVDGVLAACFIPVVVGGTMGVVWWNNATGGAGVSTPLAVIGWLGVSLGVVLGPGGVLLRMAQKRERPPHRVLIAAGRCGSCGAALDDAGVCMRHEACGSDWSAGGRGDVVGIRDDGRDDAGRPITWYSRPSVHRRAPGWMQILRGVSFVAWTLAGVWLASSSASAQGFGGVWQVEVGRALSWMVVGVLLVLGAGRLLLRPSEEAYAEAAGGALLSGHCPACAHVFLDGPLIDEPGLPEGVGACPRCAAAWSWRRARRTAWDERWHEQGRDVLLRSWLWEQRVFGVPGMDRADPEPEHLSRVRASWRVVYERIGTPRLVVMGCLSGLVMMGVVWGVTWWAGAAAWLVARGFWLGVLAPMVGVVVVWWCAGWLVGSVRAARVRRVVVEERLSRDVCPACAGVLGGSSDRKVCWSCGAAWDARTGRVIVERG